MAKHFIDKVGQNCSAAIILNSAGDVRGRILVHYTSAEIGMNHEVGIVFYGIGKDERHRCNFGKTRKGNCYANPETLVEMLCEIDCSPTSHDKPVIGVGDYLTSFSYVDGFKIGNHKFRIVWAIS